MRNSVFIKALTALCYIGLMPLCVLAAFRILHLENFRMVVVFETVTFYFLLPAYLVLLFAIFVRDRGLIVISVVLVLLHIFWFAPEWLHHRSASQARLDTATRFTLFSQNVMYDNRTPEDIGQQILGAHADLVFLQELSFNAYQAIKPSLAEYSYTFVNTSYGPTGLGIFSKFPLSDEQNVTSPGFPQQRAVADVNGKQLVLWNVHMRSPVDGPLTLWSDDLAQLKTRIHSETEPTLVAGDFNSTFGHRPYRELLNDNYHEAAIDLDRGYSRTWPVDMPKGKSAKGFVRLDHVIYNQGLIATSMHEVPGNGSDHRGLIVNLALF